MNSEKVNQSDPFDWTPVIIFVLLAGGIAGAMICVRWWLQRKSKNGGLFQARVMKHVPYDEQPNRKMPEILNEMDRGLEE